MSEYRLESYWYYIESLETLVQIEAKLRELLKKQSHMEITISMYATASSLA